MPAEVQTMSATHAGTAHTVHAADSMYDTAKTGAFTAVNGEPSTKATSFRPMMAESSNSNEDSDTIVVVSANKRKDRSPAPDGNALSSDNTTNKADKNESTTNESISPTKRKRSLTIDGEESTSVQGSDPHVSKRLTPNDRQVSMSSPPRVEAQQTSGADQENQATRNTTEPSAPSDVRQATPHRIPDTSPEATRDLGEKVRSQTSAEKDGSVHVTQSISSDSEEEIDRSHSVDEPQDVPPPNPGTATKRKREFSHRTKTGCHTCRMRKKKCDEHKPTCQNCARGNFFCGGYGPRPPAGFKVTTITSSAPPLQQRSNYDPQRGPSPPDPRWQSHQQYISRAEAPYYAQTGQGPPGPPHLHYHQGPPHPQQDPYPREMLDKDNRQRQAAPEHINLQYNQLAPVDYRDVQAPQYHHNPQHRQPPPHPQSHPPPHQAAYPPRNYESPVPATRSVYNGHESVGSSNSRRGSYLPPAHPRSERDEYDRIERERASYGSRSALSRADNEFALARDRLTERERMLMGAPYQHWRSQTLTLDKRECEAAVELYNRSQLPSENLDFESRASRFKAIINPAQRHQFKNEKLKYKGSIGDRTVVEWPFHCEFGYNIFLGDDSVLQGGCSLQDPCEITIGNRCIIGRNVQFCGITTAFPQNARNGCQGEVMGGSIRVEDDVYIGAGSIVQAYRVIGKGAYIEPGSVITANVPPGVVMAGNPAKPVMWTDGNPYNHRWDPEVQQENQAMMQEMRDRTQRRSQIAIEDLRRDQEKAAQAQLARY